MKTYKLNQLNRFLVWASIMGFFYWSGCKESSSFSRKIRGGRSSSDGTFENETAIDSAQSLRKPRAKDSKGNDLGSTGEQNPAETETQRVKTAASGAGVVWKRFKPFEQGLAHSLELKPEDLCKEMGKRSCINDVHLTVLGGNEPFYHGHYERVLQPTILTPIAIERIVLSACQTRVQMDITLGTSAVIFKNILTQPMNPESVTQTTRELFQRFLARDPSGEEIATSLKIGEIAKTPDHLAMGLCFLVGTHAENIFL